MNSGQMLITISAMMLLSTVILNVNRNSLATSEKMAETKYQILGVSIATSVIEEAFSKSFDEKTADLKTVETVSDLSSSLGSDGAEHTRNLFDDFDDYDGYSDSTSSDTTVISAEIYYECSVDYVSLSSSSINISTTPTWHKQITVRVTSPYIGEGQDTIVLSKINSHYYFR